MKRFLVFMLLLLGFSLFFSCNSYDVEGKPEVASNPAKMVFAYYPWDEGGSTAGDSGDVVGDSGTDVGGDSGDSGDVSDSGDSADDSDVDSGDSGSDSGDSGSDSGDSADDGDVSDSGDSAGDSGSDSGDSGSDSGDSAPENPPVMVVRSTVPDVITQEFEIYNRAVTGELKIRKINLIDPNGQIIDELENETYKKLFQIEIQKTVGGIASEGWNEKRLAFDNMVAQEGENIASLCPLDINSTERRCKGGFDETKYNNQFKIRLNYDKNSAAQLKDNPPKDVLEGSETLKYKSDGDFWIEICTNDPTKGKTDTCGDNSTSYRIQITRQPNKPPKPIIHVSFEDTTGGKTSYRNIFDKVRMDLKKTCVSDPNDPTQCLKDWQSRYYIKYKWEMKESPTPLLEGSQLKLIDSGDGAPGQWINDNGINDNPKTAGFTGFMITPRRYAEMNPTYDEDKCNSECGEEPSDVENDFYFLKLSNHLICRQKYCEKHRTKHYKINIQAETVDKTTDLVSDTADITVVPKIIPQARVVAQLTWKQGFKTKAESDSSKDGSAIDIDIHMIKRNSLEAGPAGFLPENGVLGTSHRSADLTTSCPITTPECEKYWRHDDCSFADQGRTTATISADATIAWHASLDIDNTWGGNNYETPETIGLGPITDSDNDGIPDVGVMDDQYLIVAGYVACNSKYADGVDRCDPNYTGEDSVYEVDARVDILIDGVDAPRELVAGRPADNYADTTKDFKIKHNEWKVLAVVKWDNKLPSPETNPKYPGNAIVSDVSMNIEEGNKEPIEVDPVTYPTCVFDNSDAVLVPIWDSESYQKHIESPRDSSDEFSSLIGNCY